MNKIGYNKLATVILQKYRDNGNPITLSEAYKKADKVGKKIDLNSDSEILSAAARA